MRVMDIASLYTCEYTPEEIQAEHPFLSLAEIYQALAYYLDHREAIDVALNAPASYTRSAEQRG